jgi:hypothetical protein
MTKGLMTTGQMTTGQNNVLLVEVVGSVASVLTTG